MKVILLGYMASGKTSIGKRLAKALNIEFIDLDDFIEEIENKSVTNIFSENGEIYFRKTEHESLKKLLSSNKSYVLALGGGTPCYAGNMGLIKQANNVNSLYLKANNTTLIEKLIRKKAKRPLVANLKDEKIPEFVAKHLFERRPFYEQAHLHVNVDGKSKDEIVAEILEILD